MKKPITVFVGLCFFFLSGIHSFAGQELPKLKEKDLPSKYQAFLTLVTYLITAPEKEVFLQLTNDRDRDIFVESFWKVRDPTPGTLENEYKTEIERRFAYVNKTFFRGTSRPGWMTDRGRFYMILGEPQTIDRYPNTLGIIPCEVWYYYTNASGKLPGHFGLIFFQRGGVGEYKLYDPAVDGPKSLMTATRDVAAIQPDDYETQHEFLVERAPALADIAVSLIPGEYGYNYQPSSRNTVLLADIVESPKANINPSYATHFLNYRGLVSTEYMTNYVDCEGLAAVIPDPVVKADFLHFSIKPVKISVDYYEPKNQYYCPFIVSVSLRIAQKNPDEVVFQYSKEFPFYFARSDVERVQANGVTIEDSFPVAEGKYKLSVLLQNPIAKEFSVFEQDISLPAETGQPRISGPFFGYHVQSYSANLHIPFKVMDRKLVVDPKNTFGRNDTISVLFSILNSGESLWKQGGARIAIRGASGKLETQKSLNLPLRDFPFGPYITVVQSLAAKEFPPDYYEVAVTLLDGEGKAVDTANGQFIVSPAEAVGHPIANAKGIPLENKFLFYGMLASQYAKLNDFAKAETYYQKVFALKPDFVRGYVDYARFLLKAGQFDKSLEAAEKFKNDGNFRFDYFQVRGRALLEKAEYARAVIELLEANKIYNSDTGVLNSLGFCFYKLGRKKEALDSLQASLKMNSNQDDIKKLIAEVEKTLR